MSNFHPLVVNFALVTNPRRKRVPWCLDAAKCNCHKHNVLTAVTKQFEIKNVVGTVPGATACKRWILQNVALEEVE